MKTHTFVVYLYSEKGRPFTRTEWGRTRQSAARAIISAYGKNLEKYEYDGITYYL